jgi:hypothetical protein
LTPVRNRTSGGFSDLHFWAMLAFVAAARA